MDKLEALGVSAETAGESRRMESLRKIFALNFSNITILGVCLIFASTAILQPSKTGMSLYDIIMGSILAFAASMSLNTLFNNKAVRDGLIKPEVTEPRKKYDDAVDRIFDGSLIDALDEHCREENRKNYKAQRTRVLSTEGLSYDACFNDDGSPKEISVPIPGIRDLPSVGLRLWIARRKRAKRQIRVYSKAVCLKLTEISAGELTGEGGHSDDPFYMGQGIAEYMKKVAGKNMVSKIVISLILGYYCADVIADFSAVVLVTRIFQTVFFLVAGAMQYMSTMSFMVGDYSARLTKKTRHIQVFLKKGEIEHREVPGEHGHSDHESTGDGETDRELHAVAGSTM